MSRLPRPPIPVEVRCRVALRQLGEAWPDDVIRDNRFVPRAVPSRSLTKLLRKLLARIAELLGCAVSDLRLDHDPALENREKTVEFPSSRRLSGMIVVPENAKVISYSPDANDPEHLFYRPHGAQFAGSHDVKTRVRGDRGQLSDNALAKKERHRLRKLDPKRRKAKLRSRRFQKSQKRKWPSRKFGR